MSWKKVAAIVGMGLFLAGVGLALFLWSGGGQAELLDQEAPGPIISMPVSCTDLVTADAFLSRRVMAKNETQALTVRLSNSGLTDCNVTVELNAPRFTIAPVMARQTILVPADGLVTVIWIISPHELGVYDLAVKVGGRTTIVGVTVTNILGLTAVQAQLVSMLATFLGPMLSAPWWFERWQEWRKKTLRQKKLAQRKEQTQQADQEA